MNAAGPREFVGTDRFEVVSKIGEGGGGVVHEVLDRERNVRCALKTIRTLSPDALLLLKDEFRGVQGIDHPNLVRLDELFEVGGQWFFTMEFVRGTNFLTYVRGREGSEAMLPSRVTARHRVAPESREEVPPTYGERAGNMAPLRACLGQIVRGLGALHALGKVHRDVKPSNVLVTHEGRVVIVDFGIVSDRGRASEGIVGSPHYMAPEQAASEAVGPAADWYALGTMLYEALTGRLPFEGAMHEVLERKLIEEPPPPSAVAADVPDDLDALCVDLLRVDPDARPSRGEILRRLGMDTDEHQDDALSTATLVGRRRELAVLDEAFAAVCAGRATTVLVQGESGVGKTFLVRGFLDRLEGSAALVLRGRCYERESVPYKGVDGIVDDLTRFLTALPDADVARLLPDGAGLLRRMFPVLEQVAGVAGAPGGEDVLNPQEMRARVFAAFRQLFARIAERGPLVLVIDDLQWADADSMSALAHLLQPPSAPPLLMVATVRAVTERRQRARAVVPDGALPGDVVTIVVEPLPPADAEALVVQLLGASRGVGRSQDEIAAIAREGNGHPLFINELVRQRSTPTRDAAPMRLDDALWRRVERLDEAARAALELLCVAGAPLVQETATLAAGLSFGRFSELLARLRGSNFVRLTGARRTDWVEPYHDRVRESVVAHVDDVAKRMLHGRLAVALEASKSADLESLAMHWRGAGNGPRAGEYAARAADQAAAALAFDHAATLYRDAVELLPEGEGDRRALKIKLAEALSNAGRGAEAAEVYVDAAGEDASPATLDVRRRAAREFLGSGHFDRGNAMLRAVLATVGVHYPRTLVGTIVALLFVRLLITVRGLGFTPRPASQIPPSELFRIDACLAAGAGFGMSDHIRGAYFVERCALMAVRSGEPGRVAIAFANAACGSSTRGTPGAKATMLYVERGEALARGLNVPSIEALARNARGWAHFFVGRWAEALPALIEATDIARERCVGMTYEINTANLILYRAMIELGRLAALAERVLPDLREVEKRGDLYAATNLRSNVTYLISLASDDADAAAKELVRAREHLSRHGYHVQHMYCGYAELQIDLYRGRADLAEERMEHERRLLRRSFLLKIQKWRVAFLDQRARICILRAAGPDAAKAAQLRRADQFVRAIERERLAWGNGLASLLRSQIASARGDREQAIAQARGGAGALDACDMALHAAVARRRLGALLGADEGAALVAAADAWMRAEGIAHPVRMAALYAPGEL